MHILAILLVLAAAEAQAAAEPSELVTAANAILCIRPGDLSAASQPAVAQSQRQLRDLHCMRTEPGIPLTVIERPHASVWKIRFRPQGIPGGVTLWGRVTSFATPDGSPLIHSTRAER